MTAALDLVALPLPKRSGPRAGRLRAATSTREVDVTKKLPPDEGSDKAPALEADEDGNVGAIHIPVSTERGAELIAAMLRTPPPTVAEFTALLGPYTRPTADHLLAARDVLEAIVVALQSGRPDQWEKIQRAAAMLYDLDSDERQRAAALVCLYWRPETFRERSGADLDASARLLIAQLGHICPAFRKLSVKDVLATFRWARSHAPGGTLERGLPRTLAELAVKCGAWGATDVNSERKKIDAAKSATAAMKKRGHGESL